MNRVNETAQQEKEKLKKELGELKEITKECEVSKDLLVSGVPPVAKETTGDDEETRFSCNCDSSPNQFDLYYCNKQLMCCKERRKGAENIMYGKASATEESIDNRGKHQQQRKASAEENRNR